MYIYLRYHSIEALLYWDFIQPIYFQIIFVTDTILTVGVLGFIRATTFDEDSKRTNIFDSGKVINPVE